MSRKIYGTSDVVHRFSVLTARIALDKSDLAVTRNLPATVQNSSDLQSKPSLN